MFFELRQYRAWPGKRDELARYMEDVIIPFQTAIASCFPSFFG